MPPYSRQTFSCRYCGTFFTRQPNQIRRGECVYCSVPCKRADKVKTPAQRLWEKVDRSGGPDACWPYTTVTRDAYPIIGYDAGEPQWKGMAAHQLVYILTHGPIPKHAVIRHTCDNKVCCNPAHLIKGTHQDNMQDAVTRQRMVRGEQHHKAKLTATTVQQARKQYRDGLASQSQLARNVGISQSTMHDILRYKIWRHVPDI